MKHTKTLLGLLGLVLFGAACAKSTTNTTSNSSATTNTVVSNTNSTTTGTFTTNNTNASTAISWNYTGSSWIASGTPPTCPDPILAYSPVNVAAATAILYPGQTRGGQYKPHGGFRFDTAANNTVTVKAPFDAQVVNGSRYIEGGETQYLFTFINPCGMMFRFDHLLTLSPALQAVANTLPAAQVDDSRTTQLSSTVTVHAGDTIATAVGFAKTKNVAVDFGLYDLRTKNTASANAAYAAAHGGELDQYAVCWLPLLPGGDATKAAALPGGDSIAGKTSDYCTP